MRTVLVRRSDGSEFRVSPIRARRMLERKVGFALFTDVRGEVLEVQLNCGEPIERRRVRDLSAIMPAKVVEEAADGNQRFRRIINGWRGECRPGRE